MEFKLKSATISSDVDLQGSIATGTDSESKLCVLVAPVVETENENPPITGIN